MSKELKIRAAKALRWERFKTLGGENYSHAYVISREMAIKLETGTEVVLVEKMKFTTSYDWAMLGVELLEDNEKYVRLESDAIEIFDFEGNSLYQLNHLTAFPSPEQITQAWVEVLEQAEEGKAE